MPISKSNPLVAPIWEQQKGESAKMYGYFTVYREMPYGCKDPMTGLFLTARDRSLTEAAEICGRNRSLMGKASQDWHWQNRVAAYDKYREALEIQERNKARAEAVKRFEQRQIEYRDDMAKLFEKVKDRIHQMLEGPVFEESEEPVFDEEGKQVGVRLVKKPMAWNWNTIAKLVDSLTRAGTFAAGIDEAGVLDRLISNIDPAVLTPDQRRRIINGEEPIKVLFGVGASKVPSTGD